MARDDSDDPLGIPEFLKVKNRKDLTPEQEAAVQRAFAAQAANQGGGSLLTPRDPKVAAAAEAMREQQRQQRITAMQNRIARAQARREQKPPPGAVWDVRTSRWVLPGTRPTTPGELIAQAAADPRPTKQIMDQIKKERQVNKPNFAAMTGKELLAEFNKLSATPRKARFSSKPEALAAVEKAWAAKHPPAKAPTAADVKAAKERASDPKNHPRADKADKADKAAAVVHAGNELTKAAKGATDGARSRKLAMKIKVVTKKNPRREGTDAHRHYVEMRDGRTVGEYLAAFAPEARRTAAQWLSNTVRDGHVQVV